MLCLLQLAGQPQGFWAASFAGVGAKAIADGIEGARAMSADPAVEPERTLPRRMRCQEGKHSKAGSANASAVPIQSGQGFSPPAPAASAEPGQQQTEECAANGGGAQPSK
ncbi:hypothetical protein H4R99_008480 [Coemansia sp. RSA 1722]|nr:hypothetical protein H4R99_008480 [Coemansia sp. RSA 1722]